MKKKRFQIFLCAILALLPLLSGCSSLRANYREVEQLRIVQSLGLDRTPGGVRVTLSAAADSGSAPLCFVGVGESISAAIDNARSRSVEEDLFTGHLRHILIGEEAARVGVGPLLSYICRSPDARMDMPVFILQGGTAQEAMSAAGDGEKGAAEALQASHSKLSALTGGHVFTAAEILRALERQDCALVCALRAGDASEEEPAEGEAAPRTEPGAGEAHGGGSLAPAGYAVLQGGKLVDYLDPDSATGADFLMNTVGIRELVLQDRYGAPVTVEINRGSTRLHPLFDAEGALQGVEIYAEVSASVLETETHDRSAVKNADFLTGRLEAAVSERINTVLNRSRTLQADFLGLADRIEQAAPLDYRRQEQPLGPILPRLELSIAVHGELLHSHDVD